MALSLLNGGCSRFTEKLNTLRIIIQSLCSGPKSGTRLGARGLRGACGAPTQLVLSQKVTCGIDEEAHEAADKGAIDAYELQIAPDIELDLVY